ncbi:META domain-containing protein [Nitratireductor aquibiodomus]|uniref:META domain-containing protein n=1 Tax=Nitratireductor aquibiodomus TaxID=204799 RepID=UPI0019D38F67|nr:META domain-containing protein [Nitratireductor aquibiodomus]MBN7763587.1 META domain-containing protein [Nitratireductor aquibiodomus]
MSFQRRSVLLGLALLSTTIWSAPSFAQEESMLKITGELTYFARIALPEDALAIVELREADADASQSVAAETRIATEGRQVPIPFTLSVDRETLDKDGTYQLRGGILDGLQPGWISEPVAIDIAQTEIDLGTLIMKPYEAPAPFGVVGMDKITGTEWVVEDIDGGGIIDSSNVTVTFGEDGRVAGNASCNRYTAGWEEDNGRLTISQAASTRMACAEALMNQEKKFLEILADVTFFTMTPEGALVLQTVDGRTLKAFPAG